MNRKSLLIGLLVAVVLGGAYVWMSRGPVAGGPLSLAGNVEVRQVNLAFKVAGRIKRLAVDEGGTVAEGQTLGELDKVYFEETLNQLRAQRDQMAANLAKIEAGNRPEEIAQAEASVAEREATVANANQAFERADQLLKTSAGTRKAYDDAIATKRQTEAQLNSARQALRLMKAGSRQEDIAAARAQLADKQAAVTISERQLADAELKAPSAGTVLSRVREVGAIVNAGETVFVESLTTPVWIRSYVSELDLARVHPGMDVTLTIDGPKRAAFKGRIGFISTTAEFTPKTVETRELRTALVYRLRVVADDPGGILRQGMPVTVTVPPDDANALASRAK